MKRAGKLFLVLFLFCSMLNIQVVHAEEAGYVYKDLHVDVDVNDAREYRVKETMTVNFLEEMHGIMRDIPKSSNAESYQIKDVVVEGMPYQVDESDHEVNIRIGDANKMVKGEQKITLSYTLVHYKDYDQTYDYIYLNLLGSEYDTSIQKFSAAVRFASADAYLSYTINDGSYSTTGNTYVTASLQGNELQVTSRKTIPAYNGVTLQMKFKEGAFAKAPDYVYPYIIKNNDIQVEVDDQQNFMVHQTLQVEFDKGYIAVVVPLLSNLWAEDSYQISSLKVNGEEKNDTKNARYYHQSIAPRSATIEISYQIHPYFLLDKRVKLLLTDIYEDTKVEQMSFRMNLPYEPDANITLKRRGDQNDPQRYLTGYADNHFQFQTLHEVQSAEEVIIELPMDAAFYTRDTSGTMAVGFIVSGIAAMVVLVLRFTVFRKKELIIPVNFYPPKGINPADAGYIIDMKLSDSDVTSLLFYWADQHYLKIHNVKGEYSFEKTAHVHVGAPLYEVELFERLFDHGDGVHVKKKDLEDTFYQDVQEAQRQIKRYYRGAYALRDQHWEWMRIPLFLLSLLPGLLCVLLDSYVIYQSILRSCLYLLMIIPLFVFGGLMALVFHQLKETRSFGGKLGMGILLLFLSVVVIGIAALLMYFAHIAWWAMGAIGLSIVLLILVWRVHKDSAYREELLVPLLGFKEFIQTAEKERLELLLEQDPEYYYHILPYAQVLHVSDIWENKFKDLLIPAPVWYVSNEVFYYASFHHFVHTMNRDMHAAATPPAPSGGGDFSSGGGFSGGGGGFSGGGFSGGGSGGGGSSGW